MIMPWTEHVSSHFHFSSSETMLAPPRQHGFVIRRALRPPIPQLAPVLTTVRRCVPSTPAPTHHQLQHPRPCRLSIFVCIAELGFIIFKFFSLCELFAY